jgi:hypothetical protein
VLSHRPDKIGKVNLHVRAEQSPLPVTSNPPVGFKSKEITEKERSSYID